MNNSAKIFATVSLVSLLIATQKSEARAYKVISSGNLELVDGSVAVIEPRIIIDGVERKFNGGAKSYSYICSQLGYKVNGDLRGDFSIPNEKVESDLVDVEDLYFDIDPEFLDGVPLHEVLCSTKEYGSLSKLATKIVKAEGSDAVSIEQPSFVIGATVANGRLKAAVTASISAWSDATGVCNLYGYNKFSGSISVEKPAVGAIPGVKISRIGKLEYYEVDSPKVIQTIGCASKSPSPAELFDKKNMPFDFFSAWADARANGNLRIANALTLQDDTLNSKMQWNSIQMALAAQHLVEAAEKVFGKAPAAKLRAKLGEFIDENDRDAGNNRVYALLQQGDWTLKEPIIIQSESTTEFMKLDGKIYKHAVIYSKLADKDFIEEKEGVADKLAQMTARVLMGVKETESDVGFLSGNDLVEDFGRRFR